MSQEIEVLFRFMIGRLLSTTRIHSSAALEGLLFIVFIALNILSRLRQALKTKVSSHKTGRAAQANLIDFDKTYADEDFMTITMCFEELSGITVTVPQQTNKARLANLTSEKVKLVEDLGFGDLFGSADRVWELLSAKCLSDKIKKVRQADSQKVGTSA